MATRSRSRPEILERGDELDRLGDAMERVVAERDGTFVAIEGPAGIGKSRLLEETRAVAADLGARVLAARGGELERDFAFGVVNQLFERALAELSEDERDAVFSGSAALAAPTLGMARASRSESTDVSFAVVHGLYWVTANLAAARPLVIEVDDVHWADAPSLRFLLYLAARLEGLPVAVVVAARPAEPGADLTLLTQILADPRVRPVEPGPLSEAGCAALIAARFGAEPGPEFATACHGATGGNPFLIGELADALARDGAEPTDEEAERVRKLGPETVSRSLLLRLMRLPPACASVARAVAVLGTQADLRPTAELAGVTVDAAAGAVDALDAVSIFAGTRPLDFLHPILREAVYGDLTSSERAAMHARAAKLLRASGADAREIAAHLLAADPAGQRWVVGSLREAGASALGRGAPDAAQRYLRRALAEPPGDDEWADVLAELGTAEWLSAEAPFEAIEHLKQSVAATPEPNERAARVLTLARATLATGDLPGAFEVLEREIARLEGADSDVVLRLEAELGAVGLLHPPTLPRAGERMERFAGLRGTKVVELLQLTNLAMLRWLRGSSDEAAALAEQAVGDGRLLAAETSDSLAVYQAAFVLTYAERFEQAEALLEAILADARAKGSVFGFSSASAIRANLAFRRGDVVATEAEVRNALEVPALPPFARPMVYTYLALALVERGELDEADRAITESGVGPYLPELLHFNLAFHVRALLRLAQGRPDEALADLLELKARDERLDVRNPGLPWPGALAQTYLRLGEEDKAREIAAGHVERARRWGTRSAIGEALHVQALVAGSEGEGLLREAVETLAGSPARLDHARALVDLGRAIRVGGRRAEARKPLREGLELARSLGATALAERAHSELETAGARPRRLMFSGVEALTASERRVADMAASGQTNREIAQALFITVRTVENHLTRVYAKLDIKSRDELQAALGEPRE